MSLTSIISNSSVDDGPAGKWDLCGMDTILKYNDRAKYSNLKPLSDAECSTCRIEMLKIKDDYHFICPKCAAEVKIGNSGEHTIGAGENHNTSSNAYMSFKPVGLKNKLYYNAMVKYTSEYEPYRDAQILQMMKQYNYISEGAKIPDDVLKAACEMFIALKVHDYVRRGKTRRGVLGACIFVQCINHDITKPKSLIAKLMQVEESKITFGLDELKQFAKLGVIEIPENIDPTAAYIRSYFEMFDLPEKYIEFVIELVDRMTAKKIEEVQSCFNTTKCIGAVYFLSRHFGLGLTHEIIAKNCDNISRGTYLNVTNAILKNETKLRKVFVRHNVHVPTAWTQPIKS